MSQRLLQDFEPEWLGDLCVLKSEKKKKNSKGSGSKVGMFLDILNVMLQYILTGMSKQFSRMWTGLEIKMWQSLRKTVSMTSPWKTLERIGRWPRTSMRNNMLRNKMNRGGVDKWRRLRALSPREYYLSLILNWFYGGYCAKKKWASEWLLCF